MAWLDLEAEIAAEFGEAQDLSPWLAEQQARLRRHDARAEASAISVACAGPGCAETIPLYRPRDPHPADGPRYCSPRCKRRAWRAQNLERDRAQNRASYRHRKAAAAPPARPVPDIRADPDYELHRQRAEWRSWKR
jgi:hypothetical protein